MKPGSTLGVQWLGENVHPTEAGSEVARGEEGDTITKVTRGNQEGFVDPGGFLRPSGIMDPPMMSTY